MKSFQSIDFRARKLMVFGAYGLATLLIYWPALTRLVFSDWSNEDYSHSYLMPFIVLYLMWEKRKTLSSVPSRVSWWALLPLCLGLVLFWLGELGGEYFTLYVSFWLVIVSMALLHCGWEKLRTIWFPLVMMLGMFPLPFIVNTRLTLALKLISSRIGVVLLQLYGMSAYREGNVIDLGFTQLQVVEACSGLRYVIPLLVLAILLAYWFRAHWWKRAFVIVSSIPLAIFVNAFRIAATGVLYSVIGAQAAEGFFHGFSGWLIFLFCIPFLLFEMWVLRWMPPKGQRGDGSRERGERQADGSGETGEGSVKANRDTDSKFKIQNSKLAPFVVAILLLGLTFTVSKTVDFREKVPIKKPLASLPLQIGEWKGDRERMEQQFIDALHFSDYAMVDYTNPGKRTVSFYTAYYESQRRGQTTHSPESCLPGSGWEFREAGAIDVPIGAGKSMRINRAFMEKSGAKDLTYYWFAQRGRTLTNLYQVKFYSFWDALTKQRTDGALVRLITPVYPNEKAEDAEARLKGFTAQIVPVLKEYIPE